MRLPREQRRLLSIALFGAVALSRASDARAEGLFRLAPGQTVEAGATIEIAWTLSSRRADFDEMELLLSLDGGRTYPLRVSRDISPLHGSLFWHVPALPTHRARLALRTGRRGVRASEIIRLVGEEFTIRSPSEPLEELFPVLGELWTREALGSPAETPPADPRSFGTEPQTIGSPAEDNEAAESKTPLPEWRSQTTLFSAHSSSRLLGLAPPPPLSLASPVPKRE